ncbi:MAG TPA: DUF6498-containing protein [Thermoanaerobaculia bacterium]|nr:DUF6498-containing protein [Thermoanaerobaculia bacterium]HUM30135.1 DUF6498-containing protein [Thermoanaerobaculia bacterium]HXK68832.1 DUF6498-containing protein [Thermoanaerobaculia bacterium]
MRSLPVFALVIAHIVLAGLTLLYSWGYFALLLTLWAEGFIIGFFNLGRIFLVCLGGEPFGKHVGVEGWAARLLWAIVLSGFFMVKYGGLVLGFGIFSLILPGIMAKEAGGDGLREIMDGLSSVTTGVLIASLVFFLSHGTSFFINYIGRKEFKKDNVVSLLFWPYARMAAMICIVVIAIFVSVAWVGLLESATFSFVLVFLKLGIDLFTHRVEHRRAFLQQP